mgnify:CR=1 FL=1
MKVTKTHLTQLIKEEMSKITEMRYAENKETGRWEEVASLDEMPSFKADTYEERSAKAERNRRERSRTDLGWEPQATRRGDAREDIKNAINMLEDETDHQGTLFNIIGVLQDALAKL